MNVYTKYIASFVLIISSILVGQMSFAAPPSQDGSDLSGPPAILSFQADVPSLRLAEVEGGDAEIELAWTTINVSTEHTLLVDQFVIDDWIAVEREDETPLPANGELTVTVRHPLNFGSPTFRLSIMADKDVIDQQFLIIPFEPEHDIIPIIETFTTVEPDEITGLSLANGSARLEVAWRVNSRIPGSHLVFEQVFESGGALNIELPRSNLWVRSNGTGVLIPVEPPGREGLTVRLRVVDTRSDRVYDEMVIDIPIVAPFGPINTAAPVTPQPTTAPTRQVQVTPTVAPPPQPTATSSQPRITSFSATPDRVNRDETVTLAWEVEGPVTMITIALMWEGFNVGYIATPAVEIINFSQSGTYTYTVAAPYSYDPLDFKLEVEGPNQELISAVQTIRINCIFSESLLDRCPETQTQIQAAYQPFEHGFMVWRGDIGVIYTVYDDLRWSRFGDTYTEGETLDIDEPPEGLFAPQRGFGKVWASNPNVSAAFGWATAPEQGYTATLETYALGGRDPHLVLTLPDGRVMEIIGPSPTVQISQ